MTFTNLLLAMIATVTVSEAAIANPPASSPELQQALKADPSVQLFVARMAQYQVINNMIVLNSTAHDLSAASGWISKSVAALGAFKSAPQLFASLSKVLAPDEAAMIFNLSHVEKEAYRAAVGERLARRADADSIMILLSQNSITEAEAHTFQALNDFAKSSRLSGPSAGDDIRAALRETRSLMVKASRSVAAEQSDYSVPLKKTAHVMRLLNMGGV